LSAEQFASRDPNARIAVALLRRLFGDDYARQFEITLWEGTRVESSERPRFTLHVKAPGALRAAFMPPLDLSVGRAFAGGLLEIEGDLEQAVDTLYRAA
jgi:cyclopropane-fatty-acyl-phospholipid synthase